VSYQLFINFSFLYRFCLFKATENYEEAINRYLNYWGTFSPKEKQTFLSQYLLNICCIYQGPYWGSGSRLQIMKKVDNVLRELKISITQLFMVKARASSWRRNNDLIQEKLQTASTGVYQGFLILEMRFCMCMHICYRIIKNTWTQRYIRVLTIKLTIQLFFMDCWKFFPLRSKHMQQSSNMKILRSIWKVKSSSARTTMLL
jgi:hypothetical protein